jgi:DNA repair protein RecN (Recombination protein N)
MLIELRIRNYAVAEDLTLQLRPGFSALTGETGAGKSIIVGALSLLLGERASSEVVRAGQDRSTVEAVFDVSRIPRIPALLDESGIPLEDDLLVLRREVAREGRNRAWVNGSAASAGLVGTLGRLLVDLHGQHDHQSLLRPGQQRDILDGFGGGLELAGRVRDVHRRARATWDALESLDERRRELESRRDFLDFQLGEIEGVSPTEDEDEGLQDELRVLEHAEDLARGSGQLSEELYGGDEAVADRVASAADAARGLSSVDPSLEAVAESLQEAYHLLVESGRRLGDYAGRVDQDPGRLEEVRERLDALSRLRRKFGPELSDVLREWEALRASRSELDDAAFDRDHLQKELDDLESELVGAASSLSRLRSEAARALEAEVEEILPTLGLPGGRFEVALDPRAEIEAAGAESVEFRVSLNPGFPPAPLSRVASGGELARVMLALKTILARLDGVPTLVFDEIDAGIGGEVATAVGQRLAGVAESHQVFAVTHLAQVACRAGSHLRVAKTSGRDGVTSTEVFPLSGEDRVQEIARMLGGDGGSSASREHARALLGA